jgi:hypothetical protein
MSKKTTNEPGGGNKQETDPFAGFGLTDDAREFFRGDDPPDEKAAAKSPPTAPAPAKHADQRKTSPEKSAMGAAAQRDVAPSAGAPRDAQFKWQAADFEVRHSRAPARECTECFHYVRGGAFAVEKIFELQHTRRSTGFKLIADCKSHEREFEVHELEQMIEKSKSMDTHFDAVPRIRHYCFAGSTYGVSAQIPEIKNHDGACKDFLPGARPTVSCDACTHLHKPYNERPGATARQVNLDSHYDLMRDPDMDAQYRSRVMDSMRNERQRVEQMADMDEERYDDKLSDDVMAVIFDDRPPNNSTLESCDDNGGRACVTVNRSDHCPQFSVQGRLEKVAGQERWRQLTIQNKEYRETVSRIVNRQTAERERYRSDAAGKKPGSQPQCFTCEHWRAPINIDLFSQIYFNNPEIMNLRDGYRREKKQNEAEERRICAQPGKSLGSEHPPQLQAWCDKFSTRSVDGNLQEYAYCLRVLRNIGGDCPSYSEYGGELDVPALPVPPAAPAKPFVRPKFDFGDDWTKSFESFLKPSAKPAAPAASETSDAQRSLDVRALWLKKFGVPLGSSKDPSAAKKPSPESKPTPKQKLVEGAPVPRCGRCKVTSGLLSRDGRLWCLSCGDWAAP